MDSDHDLVGLDNLLRHLAEKITQSAGRYYKLVLLVGPPGTGKTRALQELSSRFGYPLINVNLELSRLLLELNQRQRALKILGLMRDLVSSHSEEVILLDNIEILFDPSLKQDPLRLLQGLSRNKTIVAAWPGHCKEGFITYAHPDHREYRRYKVEDFLLLSTGEEHSMEDQT